MSNTYKNADVFLAKYLLSLSVLWKEIANKSSFDTAYERGFRSGFSYAADRLAARANEILEAEDKNELQSNQG
jgi:hypothetical protein